MFRRVVSLLALVVLVWGIWFSVSTSDDGLPMPFDEITFDCEPDEEFGSYISDSAGRLRDAVGLPEVEALLDGHLEVKEVFRFTWQRSFHWPYVMTLEIGKDGGKMHVLAWDGHPSVYQRSECVRQEDGSCILVEPEPIHKQVDKVILLTEAQVSQFEEVVSRTDFWELANFPCGMPGLDGANWTLEGAIASDYQYVKRLSPRDDSPVRELGSWFISATGMDLEPVY